jgi:hypothetical protein
MTRPDPPHNHADRDPHPADTNLAAHHPGVMITEQVKRLYFPVRSGCGGRKKMSHVKT